MTMDKDKVREATRLLADYKDFFDKTNIERGKAQLRAIETAILVLEQVLSGDLVESKANAGGGDSER